MGQPLRVSTFRVEHIQISKTSSLVQRISFENPILTNRHAFDSLPANFGDYLLSSERMLD